MKTDAHKTIYLKDYKPYPFTVPQVELDFQLHEVFTIVRARSVFEARGASLDVILNGEALELVSLSIDGQAFEAYNIDGAHLRFKAPSPRFVLEIVTKIFPEQNTRLEGLYISGGNYCTQCEAEGFRRITYWPDRPDVLSVYTVRVEADHRFPVLLSNGNKKDFGVLANNRHFAVWHDPYPKPCYLFALVAGDLQPVYDTYTTASGRKVDLHIYVRAGDEGQCGHAMESLKKSMRWDEETYGLEYDLDLFNIVAVSDFNMGAMENKSLNIFNTALVLAHQDTATDADFLRVESVIAHEYFHNWSGNRVTCRDWFQLSLKEGLTVFRDQEFSADMNSRAVQRIDDVSHLRRLQFAEDAGPMAHPIRPDHYIEINNFYTMTVYEKGAEVIRMLRTLLGAQAYRRGTDLYFSRHDGDAATCEDFIRCMEEASGEDLGQFRLWYSQAGTPVVSFDSVYDERAQTYKMKFSQRTPPTPGQDHKPAMDIPIVVNLLDGRPDQVLRLRDFSQSFVFENVKRPPIPSILRNFSAPVRLESQISDRELITLMLEDDDGFGRWDRGQALMLRVLNSMIEHGLPPSPVFIEAYGQLLERALELNADKALMARMLAVPDFTIIAQEHAVIDPQAFYSAREQLIRLLADRYFEKLERIYIENAAEAVFSITPEAMGRRALRHIVLSFLSSARGATEAVRLEQHYTQAQTMTERMAALSEICAFEGNIREGITKDFYERFESYPLVIDKWFAAQAQASSPQICNVLGGLRAHSAFNIRNPNRVRSLYAAFAMNNPSCFHSTDGSGYRFLTEGIIELNSINPQIAARLLNPFRDWRRYTPELQGLMQSCLEEILRLPDLAPDVFEIASKSLHAGSSA